MVVHPCFQTRDFIFLGHVGDLVMSGLDELEVFVVLLFRLVEVVAVVVVLLLLLLLSEAFMAVEGAVQG